MEKPRSVVGCPAYLRADEDPAFLQRDELRATRLQLEYLKPELTLEDQGIRSTIVLFGGTRIVEPAEARRRLADLEARQAAAPGDETLERRIAVARTIVEKSRYYEVAREFAHRVAAWTRETGRTGEFIITTGGGPGIMEAGNRGAAEAGAPTVGLNISLPMEQYPNPYITPELCLQFRYFALRKMHFLRRARALIAFPGGYGTLDELFDALCLVQTKRMEPIPIVLVGRSFWHAAFDPGFLAAEGVIDAEDTTILQYAETAEEIVSILRDWYESRR